MPLPAGWTLTNIVCTGGANILIGSNNVFDPGDTGATINLGPGENITCTFTNRAPCATTGGFDISTGTAGIGFVDPIWMVSSAPNSVPTPDAYGVMGDYGPWVAPSSSASNWIDPNNTGGPPPGTFPPTDPQGTYVFDTSFTAPLGASSFTLTFRFAADNNVKFYLNNVLIPGTSVNSAWSTLHGPITVPQTNPSGLYTLTAKVVNGTGPTGLLVEGAVKCVLPPRPHSIKGDVNCDGVVDEHDALKMIFFFSEPIGFAENDCDVSLGDDLGGLIWGDVNCDGLVNLTDGLIVLIYRVGAQLPPQPSGCPPIGSPILI